MTIDTCQYPSREVPCLQGRGQRRRAPRGPAMLAVLLLGGCTSLPPSINPVEWWHGLQGGKIAEQRPPPPGATDPDPNLATVPPKPDPSNPDMRARIADALIADRANAQYAASQAPLPDAE